MTRRARAVLRAVALGLASGALAGALAALRDWRINPAGPFRGPAGTNWAIVFETAWSWFLPVSAYAVALFVPLALLLDRRRRLARAASPPDTGRPTQRGNRDE